MTMITKIKTIQMMKMIVVAKIQFSQRHRSRSENAILCIVRYDTHTQQRRAIDDDNIERQQMKIAIPNSTSGHIEVNLTRHQRRQKIT